MMRNLDSTLWEISLQHEHVPSMQVPKGVTPQNLTTQKMIGNQGQMFFSLSSASVTEYNVLKMFTVMNWFFSKIKVVVR